MDIQNCAKNLSKWSKFEQFIENILNNRIKLWEKFNFLPFFKDNLIKQITCN